MVSRIILLKIIKISIISHIWCIKMCYTWGIWCQCPICAELSLLILLLSKTQKYSRKHQSVLFCWTLFRFVSEFSTKGKLSLFSLLSLYKTNSMHYILCSQEYNRELDSNTHSLCFELWIVHRIVQNISLKHVFKRRVLYIFLTFFSSVPH